MSETALPLFSCRSFIVSGLTFRSLIHFEFIFVYSVRECSNFILLHVAVPFSQYHLLTRLSFLCCLFLPSLWKINCVDLLLGSLFCLLIHMSASVQQPAALVTAALYSCLLCHKLIDHRSMCLFLSFLSCFSDTYFWFCSSIILF